MIGLLEKKMGLIFTWNKQLFWGVYNKPYLEIFSNSICNQQTDHHVLLSAFRCSIRQYGAYYREKGNRRRLRREIVSEIKVDVFDVVKGKRYRLLLLQRYYRHSIYNKMYSAYHWT